MQGQAEAATLSGDWKVGETWKEKALRKFKTNPFIYLGMAATVGAFVQAGVAMRRGQPQRMNYWMRMRVLMQGLTVVALAAGVYQLRGAGGVWGAPAAAKGADAEGEAEREREEFRRRLARAEQAHETEKDGGGRV